MGKQSKKQKVKDKNKNKNKAKSEPTTRILRKIPESSPPGGRLRNQAETGERDENYDLVSVLYHALKGAETCGTYLRDAEMADDEDLAEFFEDTRAEHVARANLAKQLLMSRLLEAEQEDEEDEDFGTLESHRTARTEEDDEDESLNESDVDRVEGDELEEEE